MNEFMTALSWNTPVSFAVRNNNFTILGSEVNTSTYNGGIEEGYLQFMTETDEMITIDNLDSIQFADYGDSIEFSFGDLVFIVEKM